MTKTFQPVILRFYVYIFIFKVPDFILMVQTKTRCYTKQQSKLGMVRTGFLSWEFLLLTSLGIKHSVGAHTLHNLLNLFFRTTLFFETISIFLGKCCQNSCCNSYPIKLDEFLGAARYNLITSFKINSYYYICTEIDLSDIFVFCWWFCWQSFFMNNKNSP